MSIDELFKRPNLRPPPPPLPPPPPPPPSDGRKLECPPRFGPFGELDDAPSPRRGARRELKLEIN